MITNPDWKEPEFDLDSPDEGERTPDGKFLVTNSQFFRNLSRAFHRMSPTEKAEFRRAVLENMLRKMKPASERIQ